MSPFFVQAIQLLLSLSLLIVLHEFGHFLPAKLFKTRVEKFYLFFDVKFSLLKKKIGDTVYGIGWLPLGGYVKISGMIDESMDKEQMKQPPKPWEFRSKPTWQRLIIMLGGVTMNVIVAVVIFAMMLFVWGSYEVKKMPDGFAVAEMFEDFGFQDGDRVLEVNGEDFKNPLEINHHLIAREVSSVTVVHQNGSEETISLPPEIGMKMFKGGVMRPFTPHSKAVIDSVIAGAPAAEAGIQKGDKVLAINGEELQSWTGLNKLISKSEGVLNIKINRDGAIKTFSIKPNDKGNVGVYYSGSSSMELEKVQYGLYESIGQGIKKGYWTIHDYIAQFSYVFTEKGASKLGGFGTIGSMYPDQWNWKGFWRITAIISVILAVMNLLPIPALDGGHVAFLLYEMLSGRKPNEKFMEYAQLAGFIIIIALVLYANGNDVYRWLTGS